MKLILASASPRRRELMKLITNDFETVSTDSDETLPEDILPEKASEYLAKIKAEAAAELYPEDIVIGCDTTVICGSDILGKPADKSECEKMLRELSGISHKVITGVAIIKSGKCLSFSEVTEVTFRKLTEEDIQWYTSTDEPYDKAGGYGIQGLGALLTEKINGDYYNVVGLPVSHLNQELKKLMV